MQNIKTKTIIYFWVLSALFIFSCSKKIPSPPFISEETKTKTILHEQGKSIIFIGMYSKKGNLLSYGSGFFVSQDGITVTNYHVIEKGYRAIIKTIDGKIYKDVYLLSYDKETDIALLKVNELTTPVKIGDSNLVKQGDKAVTIGNPEGLENTISDGIISGIRSHEGIKLFQITCPISHGSSGGPLYNLKGEVIGITTLMSKIGQNLNFAVPINYISVLQQEQKKVSLKEKYLKARKKLLSDYLEKQKISSILDPKDALFEKAYELYKKAMGISKLPDFFMAYGTKDPEGIRLLEEAIEINPHYHAAHYTLGESYESIKEYEKANKCFLKCIELKPKHQDAYTSLASLYKDTKHYDDALKFYFKALDVDPSNEWIYLNIGDIYLGKNNFSKAEEFYKRTFQDNYIYSYANEKLAYLYLKKGELKESWNYLKKSHPYLVSEEVGDRFSLYSKYLEKSNFYAYASVGHIYYHSNEHDKAIEYLEKAYKLNPNEFDQFYELGMSYKSKSNWQKARIHLEKALTISPNHYDANLQLGILCDIDPDMAEYYQKNFKVKPNLNRAIELFKRAKKINSKKAGPYCYLGQTYYYLKKYYVALKETKAALNIEENSYTFSQLGDIYFALSKHEDALVAYKKALTKYDSVWYQYSITKTLFELKKYNEAIAFLSESIEKHKDDLRLKEFLAESYKYKKDYETAIRKYKDVLKSDSANFSAHFGIASCYYDQQNWTYAKNWWEKAAEINPKSSASLYNIGMAYFKMQAYALAKTYFKKTLDIDPDETKALVLITICQSEIDRKNFPEKLRNLSVREGDIGILAKLLLSLNQYTKANNLWIQGEDETTPEYKTIYDKKIIVNYNVSPKIYESQGHFEKIKADLKRITSVKGEIKEAMNLFLFAVEQRISGIEQHSQGFYVKAKEYKGEYQKGRAKIKLADTYFVDALRIIRSELVKHKSDFGEIPLQNVDNSIKYYQK